MNKPRTDSGVPVVAIDGPSGSGKGTVARRLASELGWHLLDSGALYRLVAVAAEDNHTAFDDEDGLSRLAADLDVHFSVADNGDEQIFLRDRDVTAAIRTETCGQNASRIAGMQAVRTALLALQRGFRKEPGLVADGRDMGSVVFPDAEVKIFLTASAEERAQRRHKQLKDKGISVSLAALSADIAGRDRRDTERPVAPLKPSTDAVILDTTGVSIDEVVRQAGEIVAKILVDP